ncbi:MAG: hypothetical protein KDK36_16920 [Leptospiraceae bacterium]|nr:hypothetical protein [Leptospiraceae bacterium]
MDLIFIILAKLPVDITPTLPLILETKDLTESLGKKVLLFLLIAVLIWLIYSFIKAQKPKPELSYNKKGEEISGTLNEMKKILKKYEKSEDYREGCHELARLLRLYIKEKNLGKIEPETMTIQELENVLQHKGALEVFKNLSQLQFEKENPDHDELKIILKKALDLTDQKHFTALKKGRRN